MTIIMIDMNKSLENISLALFRCLQFIEKFQRFPVTANKQRVESDLSCFNLSAGNGCENKTDCCSKKKVKTQ